MNNNVYNNAGATKDDVSRISWSVTVVVAALIVSLIAVVVGFVGFIQDAHRFKAETYQNLVNQVNEQNAKIEILTNEIRDLDDSISKAKIIVPTP